MYSLAGVRLQAQPRLQRTVGLEAGDPESLLVAFLSELLYLGESDSLAFDRFAIQVAGSRLDAQAYGAPIAGQEKEIKAVTYHNLEIKQGERGLEVEIVFDV
jgi:SHS2 domain-containing protein